MLNNLFSLDDVVLIPSVFSIIKNRSQCSPYIREHSLLPGINAKLPLFTAPMSCVISPDNYNDFKECGINTIIPRNVHINTRIRLAKDTFVALGLEEFKKLINEDKLPYKMYICIDVANGHMMQLYELSKYAKEKYGDNLVLMVGNIANPDTYIEYSKIGVDYVRCGIGTGNVCFSKGTNITMGDNSKKPIEEVKVNEIVKTKNGNFKVLNTFKKQTSTLLNINKSIKCTPNHKFYVIDKEKAKYVTQDNLQEYGYYIEASNLSKEKHLLVKQFN